MTQKRRAKRGEEKEKKLQTSSGAPDKCWTIIAYSVTCWDKKGKNTTRRTKKRRFLPFDQLFSLKLFGQKRWKMRTGTDSCGRPTAAATLIIPLLTYSPQLLKTHKLLTLNMTLSNYYFIRHQKKRRGRMVIDY